MWYLIHLIMLELFKLLLIFFFFVRMNAMHDDCSISVTMGYLYTRICSMYLFSVALLLVNEQANTWKKSYLPR